MQWKLNLISEINNGLKSEPISFSKNKIKNYQKVKFTGTFNFEKQIYLYSLNNSGAPGYEVLTPLKTQFNEILLINRGWIKKDLKNSSEINSINKNKFSGILKKIIKPNPFKPDNDLKNNIWYSLNLEDLKTFTGFEMGNYILHLQDSHNEMIKPKIITPNLPNNHLKYAITWYSVALSILIYFLYFKKKQ